VDQVQREQKLIERNLHSSNFFNNKNRFIDEEPCNYIEKQVSKFNDQNRISSFDC
jgi:tRNA U34 5-carboxymethylaminomethyl modifying enzyme MnmG/GidA